MHLVHLLAFFVTSTITHKAYGLSDLQDPVLFCDGCFATISELQADISEQIRENQDLKGLIGPALDKVCDHQKLRKYKFSPPTQKRTCDAIMKSYRNQLEKVLISAYAGVLGGQVEDVSVDDLLQAFCYKETGACEGREVPTLQMRKEREQLRLLSEQQKKEKNQEL